MISLGSSAAASLSRHAHRTIFIQARSSHLASQPIRVRKDISISIHRFPPQPNPLKPISAGVAKSRSLFIRGPLGLQLVPLPAGVYFWRAPELENSGAAGAQKDKKLDPSLSEEVVVKQEEQNSSEEADAFEEWMVSMPVLPLEKKYQRKRRGFWALTRQLIRNAVVGVTEGHSRVLNLVGVGFRATVEDSKEPHQDQLAKAFAPVPHQSYWFSREQNEAYLKIFEERTKLAEAKGRVGQVLVLRLGYSHPIQLSVPPEITATTPQPTRIVLKGVDLHKLGQFAAEIRRWRPPERYKVSKYKRRSPENI